jgi:hypothetical protein
MILSCDPPRHALLIHFGKRQQSYAIQIIETKYNGARMEIALNQDTVPHTLVAVHFVRHGFRLPFVGMNKPSTIDHFNLQSGCTGTHYFFYFSYMPRDCQEWQVCPGLTVLIQNPSRPQSSIWGSIEERPVLHGLMVDTEILRVDVEMSEFVFELGADLLKDVPVTLFMDRASS